MNPVRVFDQPESEDDLIREAQDLHKEGEDAMQFDKDEWRRDMAFDAGDHWPEAWRTIREFDERAQTAIRPCLVIPRGHVHALHVQNSIKSNPPGIKARPVDDKADPKTAEIITGLIRHISSFSHLNDEWGTITETQVPAGVGYIRAYPVETPSGTEIQVCAVDDIFSVTLDPHCKNKYGMDSGWWFITDDMPIKAFEQRWPDVQPIGWKSEDPWRQQWVTDKTVRVVEFVRFEWRDQPPSPTMMIPDDVPQKKKMMVWRKLCAMTILEEKAYDLDYIPMIRVPGEVVRHVGAEGQHRRVTYRGMVNRYRDPQITYDVMRSAEVERLGLAPLPKSVGYEGQFEGHEEEWNQANLRATSYLEVKPKSFGGQLAPIPQQMQGVQQDPGLLSAAQGAAEDLRAVSGQQLANEQDLSNDASGIALERRAVSGDIATYHYPSHVQGAANWLGTILIHMAPKVFAKRQMLRILGEDDEPEQVRVDPRLPKAHDKFKKIDPETGEETPEWVHVYNLGVGQYDVVIDTGPQFETKRQEGAAALKELLAANPQGWTVLGDLFFKSLDVPYADEMARRMRKTIDPKLLEVDEEEGPAAEAKAQIQQAQQVMAGLQAELAQINQAKEVMEAQAKQAKAEADKAKAQREMEEMRLELENTKLLMNAGQMDETKAMALMQAEDAITDRFASKVIEKQKRGTKRMLTVVPRRNGSVDAETVGPLGDDYPPGSKIEATVRPGLGPDGVTDGSLVGERIVIGPDGRVLSRKTIRAIPNADGSLKGQMLEGLIGPSPAPQGPPPVPPPVPPMPTPPPMADMPPGVA